jgi:hypothetical protein
MLGVQVVVAIGYLQLGKSALQGDLALLIVETFQKVASIARFKVDILWEHLGECLGRCR